MGRSNRAPQWGFISTMGRYVNKIRSRVCPLNSMGLFSPSLLDDSLKFLPFYVVIPFGFPQCFTEVRHTPITLSVGYRGEVRPVLCSQLLVEAFVEVTAWFPGGAGPQVPNCIFQDGSWATTCSWVSQKCLSLQQVWVLYSGLLTPRPLL